MSISQEVWPQLSILLTRAASCDIFISLGRQPETFAHYKANLHPGLPGQ
jgi:hypothetical protein